MGKIENKNVNRKKKKTEERDSLLFQWTAWGQRWHGVEARKRERESETRGK